MAEAQSEEEFIFRATDTRIRLALRSTCVNGGFFHHLDLHSYRVNSIPICVSFLD